MNREEFLAERKQGLGGSDIGAILGLSPYTTPLDIWLDKTGQAPSKESNLQMRFGTMAEQFVADEYEQQTGNRVQKFTPMLRHTEAPIIGHIDRLVIPAGAKVASHKQEIRTDKLLECKTASAYAASGGEWGVAGSDMVPPAYLVQVATYMALTGCEFADLAVLFGNQEFRVYHIKRDLELEETIVEEAAAWWQRHIIQGIAPEPRTASEARALWPQHVAAKQVIVGVEVADAVARLADIKARKKSIEAEESEAEGVILAAFGDAEEIVCDGKKLCTWKANKPSKKTDWQSIATAMKAPNEVIKAYTVEKPGARVLRLASIKE